jgi:hypothetical protein
MRPCVVTLIGACFRLDVGHSVTFCVVRACGGGRYRTRRITVHEEAA